MCVCVCVCGVCVCVCVVCGVCVCVCVCVCACVCGVCVCVCVRTLEVLYLCLNAQYSLIWTDTEIIHGPSEGFYSEVQSRLVLIIGHNTIHCGHLDLLRLLDFCFQGFLVEFLALIES